MPKLNTDSMHTHTLVGRDAVATLVSFLDVHSEIVRIKLFEPSDSPLLQDTVADIDSAMLKRAVDLHDSVGVPFWEAMLLTLRAASMAPAEVLRAATYHNPATENVRILDTRGLSEARLRQIASSASTGRVMAVSSQVEMGDGSIAHLPMLDFGSIRPFDQLAVVEEIVRQLGVGGWILLSGKSFHFYGDRIISQADLTVYLARSLLFAPIVDARWVAHQLIESACALRISAKGASEEMPTVVSQIKIQ